MNNLQKDLLAKIRREVGQVPQGTDRLAFEAKVWRAVSTNLPGLTADEALALTAKLVRAYIAPKPPQAA